MQMHFAAKYSDWGLVALRIAIAVLFLFHGWQKFPLLSTSPESIPPMMLFIMRLLAIAEPLAAVAILLGLLTRFAALGLCIVMICAIYFKIVIWGAAFSGDGGWELELTALAACLALFFLGAGKYAVDAGMTKQN